LGTGVHVGALCPSFVADAGMWADCGLEAPAAMREVAPAKVIAGVRKVLRGAPEVLITPGPIRPMLALGQLFPSLDARVMRWMGVLRVLKRRAELTSSQRELPPAPDRTGSAAGGA